MCIGGTQKQPDPQAPPPPAPTPTPTDVNPVQTSTDRANRLRSLQQGLASTIKTGPGGITGKGANLTSPALTGKDTTGA